MHSNKLDLTQTPDLTKHGMGTGPQRVQKPLYVDQLPPCNNACPAGENIQAWLSLAQEAKYEAAWQKLMEDNPMPSIHGRVCYHPCEDACNRAHIDSTISIHAVERFLGDLAIQYEWKIKLNTKSSGKRVLIIGAGPSGLSASYHLRRLGHEVEIYEAGPVAGGMMHFGIPAYRLPRNELNKEIKRIEDLGVKIVLNSRVEDVLKQKSEGNFDAVFIAIGAHISKKIDIPSRDAGQIIDALSFLKDHEHGLAPKLGRRVAIYGGGNTAMDTARVAKRLGYEPLIIYRRDREHMPAHEFEADEALSEGVKINWLRSIKEINQSAIKVEKMTIKNGRPIGTGEYEELSADSLILALGQNTETEFLKDIPGIEFNEEGVVIVDKDMMTGSEGIFAGGDMVPSERTVTVAVGHGKKAARNIDAYLRKIPYEPIPKNPIVGFDRLHMWYQTFAPKREQLEKQVDKRVQDFSEVLSGFNEQEARYEAQRCLSCGNCFECDGCYGACPEEAIIKLGPGKRYKFNYNLCTGCAVCFEQCPCHAIEMVKEEDQNNL